MNANIFGTICSIFEQINLKTLYVSSKVDMANQHMMILKIPEKIQEDVRDYIMTTANSLENQLELVKFLEMLTPSLRNTINIQIFLPAFN